MAKGSKKSKKHVQKPVVEKKTQSLFLSKYSDWILLGMIAIMLMIFFYPVMFENKSLLSPDTMASRSFQPFVEDALDRDIYPLWNPYVFSGMPSFASLSRAPYTDVVSTVINGFISAITFGQVDSYRHFFRFFLNYLLLGSMVYLLLRAKKLSQGAAFFSSLAMVFMPQVIAYAAFGHGTKLMTAALIPLIFLLVDRLLEKRNLLYFCLTALAMGLQLLRGHTQICFYTQLMTGIYLIFWVFTTFKDKEKLSTLLKGVVFFVLAVVFAVLISSVVNLSVIEYADYSVRGGGESGGLNFDYATNWSFPPSEILTYLIPSFMGFGGDTYWGPMPFTDFPLYFGLILFVLAGLALIINRNRIVWFFTIFSGIVLLISFGKHFPILFGPMFKFFPFFSKFRAPKMIQIMLHFSMVVLAGYGIQGVIESAGQLKEKSLAAVKKYFLIFGGVLVLLFLILLLGKGMYLGWAAKSRIGPEAAYDKAMIGSLVSLLFFGVTFGSVLAALKGKLSIRVLPALLVIVVMIDFWVVNKNFVDFKPAHNEKSYFAESADVTFLKQQEGEFRILPVQDQRTPNWYMYHLIQSANGYQGAKLQLYKDMLDAFRMPQGFLQKYLKVENGQYTWKKGEEINPAELKRDRVFLKLMNIRYVLSPYMLPDEALQPSVVPKRRGQIGVMAYSDFLERIYFPKETTVIQGKTNILGTMISGLFDPAVTAIIEKELPGAHVHSPENSAEITSYDIHKIEIKADVKTPGLMVLSEIYYPAGWKAFVDGEETEIYKTDYALRSIYLEPGEHQVVFEFKPKMFKAGFTISLTSFILLAAGAVLSFLADKRKKKELMDS